MKDPFRLVDLQRQDRDIARLNQAVSDIRDRVKTTETEMASLQEREASLSGQRQLQAELIAEHVAAAYRLTGQDFLKQLLNQESPDKFARMIRYHRYFSESRLDALADYQATLVALEDNRKALAVQQQRQQCTW